MKWCCKVFEGWFQEAGSRGLAVFVSALDGTEPAFILQFRASEPGVPAPHTDSPLSVVSDVQIQFCPWCGARLASHYRDTYRELDRSDLKIKI